MLFAKQAKKGLPNKPVEGVPLLKGIPHKQKQQFSFGKNTLPRVQIGTKCDLTHVGCDSTAVTKDSRPFTEVFCVYSQCIVVVCLILSFLYVHLLVLEPHQHYQQEIYMYYLHRHKLSFHL